MISKTTIHKIYEEARIEEVVGDFVTLKKRGSNLTGLCPFHNEKTPSFSVSPVRGIYKCFGCGKGGDPVNFIMEHEHYTYPEALRYLANKYHIEIEETVPSPEEKILEGERESLFSINAYAQKYFTGQLQTDEGKAIGNSYFHERGFTQATIEKFQLGYSPSSRDAFTKDALANQFKIEILESAGLTIVKEDRQYDRFFGRVMFPIHNLTGRVIAFGARILKTDVHAAKYLNSPETDIYSKSKILYGIFFAKKSIVQNDECFLCEGYTDVISMSQAGIENVVASSGTSLTTEQIRLIKRYTKNITVLYDGDPAGIKASLRGIDMILEEGMNVRVILFPDGDDPDSYSKKVTITELKEFLKKNAKDFVMFKAGLLLSEAGNDPIKRSSAFSEVIDSISFVNSSLQREEYEKLLSEKYGFSQQTVILEVNKKVRNRISSQQKQIEDHQIEDEQIQEKELENKAGILVDDFTSSFWQEREIIRLLLSFADTDINIFVNEGTREEQVLSFKVKAFMKRELEDEGVKFDNELFAEIFASYDDNSETNSIELNYFLHHENVELRNLVTELVSTKYELSDWDKAHIYVTPFDQQLKYGVVSSVYRMKEKFTRKFRKQIEDELKNCDLENEELYEELLRRKLELDAIHVSINKFFGTTISN